jgi:ABC-type Zn uptake system ZnuABC Zn-binding protein ZnuA
MIRRALGGLLVLAGLAGLAGCGRMPDAWEGLAGPPRVVVTIAPVYSFVKAVAGGRAGVICLCQDKGPHDYQFDMRDAQRLHGADLFLSVGLTLDNHFATNLATRCGKPIRHVRLGERLPEKLRIKLKRPIKHGDHEHTGDDPHVWLGIEQAAGMVEVIRDELKKADPAGKDEYEANAAAYVKRLRKLGKDGLAMLADKKNKRLISFHESLAYFARTYGLQIVDVIEVGAGDEPSPKHLAHLVDLCVKEKEADRPVAAIAVEPQYPRNTSAKVVQRELADKHIAMKMIEIDPLETTDAHELEKLGADWYLEKMRANLKTLAKELP